MYVLCLLILLLPSPSLSFIDGVIPYFVASNSPAQ